MALKVCILRTDAVLDEFQPEFGDYPDMFTRLLHTADEHLDIVSVDVRSNVPTTLDCDAYVITGSRHSVYEPLPWIEALVVFLRSAIAANKRVVGICFGHQLLAHFFGGEVQGAEQGWGVGVHQAKIVARLPWMTGAEAVNGAAALNTDEELALLCSHKDQVTQLPEGATLFASSDFCPLAGFVLGDQVLTIQCHPEFSKGYSRALMEYRKELLGERAYTDGVASLSQSTDELRFAQWMVTFLRHSADQEAESAEAPSHG